MKEFLGKKRPWRGRPGFLTELIVIEMRKSERSDLSFAKEFKLPIAIIYAARTGRTWKRVKTVARMPHYFDIPEAVPLPLKK